MITKAVRCLALPASLALSLIATSATAQTVSREQDIPDLRLGQRVMVDDGSCPTGQIKEVQGSQMTRARRAAHPQVHSEARHEEAVAANRSLEHPVAVRGLLRNLLHDVPVLDDLAVLQPENVDDGAAALAVSRTLWTCRIT